MLKYIQMYEIPINFIVDYQHNQVYIKLLHI